MPCWRYSNGPVAPLVGDRRSEAEVVKKPQQSDAAVRIVSTCTNAVLNGLGGFSTPR